MTDMQLIVPPLEDNNCQEDEASSTGVNGGQEDGQNVLPEGLRANFEAMKAVWRQARRANGEEKKELKRKERALAIETAISADEEIAKWRSGIAELEAMLNADEEEDELEEPEDELRHAVVEFPSLLPVIPPVIPPEEGPDDSSYQNRLDDDNDGKPESTESANAY